MIDVESTAEHFSITLYIVSEEKFKLTDTLTVPLYSVQARHFSYVHDLMLFTAQFGYCAESKELCFVGNELAAMKKAEELNRQALNGLQETYLNEKFKKEY